MLTPTTTAYPANACTHNFNRCITSWDNGAVPVDRCTRAQAACRVRAGADRAQAEESAARYPVCVIRCASEVNTVACNNDCYQAHMRATDPAWP